MLRCLIALSLLAGSTWSSVLPEAFGSYKRTGAASAVAVDPADKSLWAEYGLQEAESASYANEGGQTIQVTAWRFQDPTGAYGVRQWLSATGVQAQDNYVIRVEGGRLPQDSFGQLAAKLPNRVSTSPPPLLGQLPAKNRVAGSERYVLGAAGLSRFAPAVPAELAGLDRGAEAVVATYRVGGNQVPVTLISYPTPQMAIAFAKQFQGRTGVAFQRLGPLIAVAPVNGNVPPRLQELLGKVQYQPKMTWNEYVSKDTPQDAARMILAIITLAGVLIASSLFLGLFFGGSKVLANKLGFKTTDDSFTSLGLGNK